MNKYKLFVVVFCTIGAFAQNIEKKKSNSFSIHSQTTIINQNKAGFKSPYEGENSLTPEHESQTSLTSTLYLGAKLWKGAAFYFNPEIAGGSGISQVLGLGDATNGETFRIGSPAPKVYLARMFFSQRFDLNKEYKNIDDDLNQVNDIEATKYIKFTIGKISLADYFDANNFSHDPRTQFMNWGLMASGAWDYAANTRGYTSGVLIEYVTPSYEIRYNISILPMIANGNEMNWNFSKQNAQNVEFTKHYNINKLEGNVRVLAFYNSGKMGNYNESVLANPASPDIVSVRKYGGSKFGFSINTDQKINDYLGCFARFGWNDGKHETWAFTEIDNSMSLGIAADGKKWNCEGDTFGLAFISSGLSTPHRNYFKAGGTAFMLGEGKLNYGREKVSELYYSYKIPDKNMYLTTGYQLIFNPGYNIDRKGPVNVFSLRLHYEL